MRTETAKKRKRISAEARKRQMLMVTGGLSILLLIVVIIATIFVLRSCGTDYTKTDANTVYVLKNGKIVSTDIEAFDEKSYDKDSLEAYIKDIVDTYNKENGEHSVKQKTLEVENAKVTLVLEYENADVYEAINGVEMFAGTIKEATDAGYDFSCKFAKVKDGKAVAATTEDFVNSEEYKVLIIKSNTKVVLPGTVCFVSTENVASVGEDYVIIKDAAQLEVDESGLGAESNTETGTEEGADDSISEDEMLSGSEDIVFDFGDEETTESQITEVLTYIIYK